MAETCKLIAAKLAAGLLVLGLLVAPLCATRCAALNCRSLSSTENGTTACHHQFTGHPVSGFAGQSCSGSCNPPELVLDLPRVENLLSVSPALHNPMAGQSAVSFLATEASDDLLDATPPGWHALSLSRISFESRPPAALRL